MNSVLELRRKWAPLDPAAGDRSLPDDDARLATLLSILVVSPDRPPVRRHFRARWLIGAAAGAALVVIVAVVGNAVWHRPRLDPQALAATPVSLVYQIPGGGSGARVRLERIAAAAAASPAPPVSSLPEHLHIATWSLFTRIGEEQVTSAVVPVEVESWRAMDGSGKLVRRYGKPQFPTPADERAWRAAGEPGADARPSIQTFAPGQWVPIWADRLPTDTAAAKAWLQQGHAVENGPAETIVAVTDLARERVLTPAERAAVLRVVAALPDLKYHGAVRDRAGRSGEAFSIESDYSGLPTRYTVIVDPGDGRLLGFEQLLTTRAGELRVPIPSVIGYETYLTADHAPVR